MNTEYRLPLGQILAPFVDVSYLLDDFRDSSAARVLSLAAAKTADMDGNKNGVGTDRQTDACSERACCRRRLNYVFPLLFFLTLHPSRPQRHLSMQWKKEQASRCCTAYVCLRQTVNQLYNNQKMAKLVLFASACISVNGVDWPIEERGRGAQWQQTEGGGGESSGFRPNNACGRATHGQAGMLQFHLKWN